MCGISFRAFATRKAGADHDLNLDQCDVGEDCANRERYLHQTVKPVVPGSNPASLQPAGTCHSLLGSQQGWLDNCRLASEGRQRQKIQKFKKIIRKKDLSAPLFNK